MKGWDLRTVDIRAHWPGIRLSSDDGRAVVLEICAGESLQGDLGVQDDVQRLGSTSSWFSLRLPALFARGERGWLWARGHVGDD